MASTVLNRMLHTAVVTIGKARSTTNFMFKKHLLITNLGLSVSLSAVGDVLEQNYEKLKAPDRVYNPRRTFNFATAGLTIGFVCHHWYNWLDKFMPGRTIGIVLKKVLIDQIICSPATISTLFVTLAIVERSSADEMIEEFKDKSWRLYLAEWVIWPPAQVINFYWLPTRYRVLYDNTISLGYDFYTSYVKFEIPSSKAANKGNSEVTIIESELDLSESLLSENVNDANEMLSSDSQVV